MGDGFSVPTPWSVTRIAFSGGYYSSPSSGADDFYIRIFAKTGGVPAATPLYEQTLSVPATFAAALINGSSGYSYNYATDIPATALGPGDYLLAITRDGYLSAGFPNPFDYWVWNGNTYVGDAFVRHSDASAWTAAGAGELSFRLEGTAVPAPGVLLLLGPALALLATSRASRRRP